MNRSLAASLFIIVLASSSTSHAQDAPRPAKEAAKHIKVPDGFNVTLFAGEPDVVQPIACTFDDRGRMWVVECFSYPKPDPQQKDRVVIFTDTDGDGRFDERKVFWERGNNTTGIALGFGGVWLSATPHLLFIADRDCDDVPDGDPQAKLDGWDINAKHNLFNALTWAPDGWLWGCNGILSNSRVGKPGTPEAKRTEINCGVWRYHPTREVFEVVAHGTTNPWGLDFDDYGQAFITNCVIHHLWHVVPGSRFERMFGQDFNQHTYRLMASCADHLHWAGGHWTESRGNQEKHSDAGGGHAHSGAMIYLGDNWPDEYRNRVFMCNIHGARVNQDRLEQTGSGYIARHEQDFSSVDDPWFRGVFLSQGPDGAAYVLDWSDTGECHDYEEVDRSNGRIYRVAYGQLEQKPFDLHKLSDKELIELQSHKNDWFVRRSRLILQERAAAGKLDEAATESLAELLNGDQHVTRRLRALWALHAIGKLDVWALRKLMDDREPYIRAWAVRLERETKFVQWPGMASLVGRAAEETSPVVRLELAAGLQRMPLEQRWPVAERLLSRDEDAADPMIPLMLWYGVEPLAKVDRARSVKLIAAAKIPLVREFLARRLAGLRPVSDRGAASADDPLNLLTGLLSGADEAAQLDVLRGMKAALAGRRSARMPSGWDDLSRSLSRSSTAELRELGLALSVLFDDRSAIDMVRASVKNTDLQLTDRERAIDLLLQKRDEQLLPMLESLLSDSDLSAAALRALAAFDDPGTPKLILDRYQSLSEAQRQDAISTLASRPSYAIALMQAIQSEKLPKNDVSTFVIRQLVALDDAKVKGLVGEVWGEVRSTPDEKRRQIAEWKEKLSLPADRAADRAHGRAIFAKNCATCHRLFDAGEKIGPDLTGGQRKNLDYVLENVVDPSAVVGRDYQVTLVQTEDGRVITGIVVEENESAITMQSSNERVVVPKNEIAQRKTSNVSLMPDDQLSRMSVDEVRDLLAYLAADEQVPLSTDK